MITGVVILVQVVTVTMLLIQDRRLRRARQALLDAAKEAEKDIQRHRATQAERSEQFEAIMTRASAALGEGARAIEKDLERHRAMLMERAAQLDAIAARSIDECTGAVDQLITLRRDVDARAVELQHQAEVLGAELQRLEALAAELRRLTDHAERLVAMLRPGDAPV